MSDIEMQKRKLLLRDFQNGVPIGEATINVAKELGSKGYSARTCQRWYQKFKTGNFDLNDKPTDENKRRSQRFSGETPNTSKSAKVTRSTKKQVQADAVPSKNNQMKQPLRSESTALSNEAMQTLVKKKRELTISKVVGGAVMQKERFKPNIITKRYVAPTIQITPAKRFAAPTTMTPSGKIANGPFNVKLPANIAKRLESLQTSAERHTIGEGRKSSASQKFGEAAKKTITVQFQNVSPDIAKNTVRKVADKAPAANANKRLAVPQSTALSLPKGVIYLNPQEIFKQSFGFQNTLQKPVHVSPFPKAVGNLPKTPMPEAPVVPHRSSQSPMTVSDSDSEDDLVFPTNISVPPPKIKALAETFTTYWDMETDKPILLNPTEDMIPSLPPVIEID